MRKRYVKKPIPIEAVQFNGDNFRELYDFAGNKVYFQDGYVYVRTLEGDMRMKNATGDYLIKGIKGEFYFCEKSIFEETYEEVPEKTATRDASSNKVIYIDAVPTQLFKNNSIRPKADGVSTNYGMLNLHTEKPAGEYAVMTTDQYHDYVRNLRIDSEHESEWQCPTCKKRVKNLQRKETKDGKPCWGCRACCDTVDESYFNGKACKLYEQGDSGYMWF